MKVAQIYKHPEQILILGVLKVLVDAEIGTGATFSVSPITTTTYVLTGTNTSGCESTAEVTVTVEEKSVAGTITGPSNVCISGNSGSLILSGQVGNIVNWEKSLDGTTWALVNPINTTITYPL